MNILDLLQGDSILFKRVASTHGGEWAGPCPWCKGDNRFRIWPSQGENGKYWCRGCGRAGDAIQYLRDYRRMTFPEACQFVGRELPARPSSLSGKKAKGSTMQHRTPQAPREGTSIIDPNLWQSMARKLVDEAVFNLWTYQRDVWLKWLTARGLNEETIKTASLGAILLDRWADPETWGLTPELKENGEIKKLWFPKGHLIPLAERGEILRIKFRRPKSAGPPPYLFLRGSSPAARVINPQASFFVIVENELDGLLVAQEGSALGVGVIALGSASIKPDSLGPEVRAALKNSSYILISLDFDEAKGVGDKTAWAGGKAGLTWLKKFPQAHRWPPVKGKDPADMLAAGVSIKDWLETGLEKAKRQSHQGA